MAGAIGPNNAHTNDRVGTESFTRFRSQSEARSQRIGIGWKRRGDVRAVTAVNCLGGEAVVEQNVDLVDWTSGNGPALDG